MQHVLLGLMEKLFPVHRHEWPKVLLLLSVSTCIGMGFTISRAAAEALFLTHFGVEYLPLLQLVNPLLVLVSTTVYGAYVSRLSHERLMVYTALLPIPVILLLRAAMVLDIGWIYFFLFAFVLAYAVILATSWSVYLPGHYDVQASKRLVPFISSGMLIGTVLGGVGIALWVSVIGAANVLFIWIATLVGVVVLIQSITRLFTAMTADTRRVKLGGAQPSGAPPSIVQSLKNGIAYSRASALFMTTAMSTIATMMALQLIDYECSKIFARAYPNAASLTAFLGIVDGLTTLLALLIQWFVVPQCIRRLGVQGTNLLFPYCLTAAFGGLLAAPMVGPAIYARFTRSSLMPSLRGTTRTLMLNAVPRKTGAVVRSFNIGVVMPVGQGAGAVILLLLKGQHVPILFPILGLLLSALYLFYSYKQNRAYGVALLELLQEDKIHLLDLEDDEIRQLDASAVAAISVRLQSDQDDVCLAAVELLRTIGSAPARAALEQHLPHPSPTVTAAILQALVTMGANMGATLQHYLDDAHPQVRMAALAGLRRLGAPGLSEHAAALLEDSDVQVQAAALAVVLAHSQEELAYERAMRLWETMLESTDPTTLIAALGVIASVPEMPLQGRVYRALDHPNTAVRRAALEVLQHLAASRRIASLDVALLRTLEADDVEIRYQALQIFAAMGTDEALQHLLVLLDDEQPRVHEALIQILKRYGKRVHEPLFSCLRSPQTSLRAKEGALLALANMEGVQADQFLAFWEGELHDVYRYKLMLACLEVHPLQDADTFLHVALRNAHDQILSLLVQLLAIWTSPSVARLVEDSLHDPDSNKRANALEALESLGERRFTRLLLPILEAEEEQQDTWRDVAQQQWHLTVTDVPTVLEMSLKSTNKWIVIGALLAGQARAAELEDMWPTHLTHLATAAEDADVRRTARRIAGQTVEEPHQMLSLTDVMLFLKRVPLYSSMTLGQLHTIAIRLTEQEMQPGEVIFHEGDLSYELYLIVSGKVDIVQHRGDIARTLATLSEGDFFGDMAIFEDLPRSADAIAAEQGALLVLSPERFRQIIMQEPAIAFEIFRELSARLRRFDAIVAAAAG
jgi:HEAT repeat protein/ATP/ADP translocase